MDYIIILPIMLLLSQFPSSKGVKDRPKTYDDILKSLEHKDKLIFDLSNELRIPPEADNLNLKSAYKDTLTKTGVRLSPLLYYRQDYHNTTSGLNQPLSFLFGSEEDYYTQPTITTELSNTFEKYTGALRDNRFVTIFVIPHNHVASFNEEEVVEQFTALKSKQDNKLGLEYEEDDDGVNRKFLFQLISQVDVVILNIDIPLEKFILSYSQFKKNIRGKLSKNFQAISKGQLINHTIYVKFNFHPTHIGILENDGSNYNLTEELYQKYYFYLLQYSVFWLNEGHGEGLILPAFNHSLSFKDNLDGVELRKLLTIRIPQSKELIASGDCEIAALMGHISTNFDRISVSQEHVKRIESGDPCILLNGQGCPDISHVCHRPTGNSFLSSIGVILKPAGFEFDPCRFRSNWSSLSSISIPWKLISLKSRHNINCDLEKLYPGIEEVACDSYYFWDYKSSDWSRKEADEEFIELIYNECSPLWNQSTVIVWNIKLPQITQPRELNKILLQVEEKRQQFFKSFPKMSVMLSVSIQQWKYDMIGDADMTFFTRKIDLYCNRFTLETNELAEQLINFARIRNTPLEISDALNYYEDLHEGWERLETIKELNQSMTKFPVFVGRNFPERFLLGDISTDPCISKTEKVPSNGIEINMDYGGTTVYMADMKNGSLSLTEEELENMLYFVFHKFSLVEIIPETILDLELLCNLFSKKSFVSNLNQLGSKPVKLYLSLDLGFLKTETHQLLDELRIKPHGIGLRLNNSSVDIDSSLLRAFKSKRIKLGIALEDCIDEVNEHFQSLHNIPYFDQVDFLICNILHPAKATNADAYKVTKYLDTTLYIQRYFEMMFPIQSREVLFRLNTVSSLSHKRRDNDDDTAGESYHSEEALDFLKFFADVGQYASLNGIKLFMFPAFDNAVGSRFGWWRILNFANLGEPSVFVEKEAHHLGTKTWRPPQRRMDGGFDAFEVIILVICGFILTLIIAGIFTFLWYRSRFVLLNRHEVDMFLYGKNSSGSDGEGDFDARKFPEEFEISKSRIILLNIIGKGNFGLVYNATLSDLDGVGSSSVAAKIPHPGCSKEAFKSILSELKVLSYIGSHNHVLGFVGAYIKEIGRGMIQVVTELCENGALQEHLRKMSSQMSETTTGTGCVELKTSLHELNRFAQEIALGMEFISGQKIVHGDLSTRNVLLDSNLVCKIGDFGLSSKLYEYREYVRHNDENLGLPWRWLAIESLKSLEFTMKSDVWSYGITLWEIFSLGSVPYPDRTYTNDFLNDIEGGFRMSAPSFASDKMYKQAVGGAGAILLISRFEEMKRCWEANPDMRPTFTELAHFFESTRSMEYTQITID